MIVSYIIFNNVIDKIINIIVSFNSTQSMKVKIYNSLNIKITYNCSVQ